MYSTILSGFIVPGCNVELPIRVRSFKPFENRPWEQGRTPPPQSYQGDPREQ